MLSRKSKSELIADLLQRFPAANGLSAVGDITRESSTDEEVLETVRRVAGCPWIELPEECIVGGYATIFFLHDPCLGYYVPAILRYALENEVAHPLFRLADRLQRVSPCTAECIQRSFSISEQQFETVCDVLRFLLDNDLDFGSCDWPAYAWRYRNRVEVLLEEIAADLGEER